MRHPLTRRAILVGAAAATMAGTSAAHADPTVSAEIAERLTADQLAAYRAFLKARGAFERQLEMYWALVEERRDLRRRKRSQGQPFGPSDFVTEQPPKYTGPTLAPEIARIVETARPPAPEKLLPTVADYLAAAEAQYGFTPTATIERDFKRRYAIEALAHGLDKWQVVRVYALETGGDGTYDMQAGFNPVTRQGKAISSAIGYAQLLNANSISELVKHGESFAQRLERGAGMSGITAAQAAAWTTKAAIVRRMAAAARTVPNEWRQHVRFAQTPQGMGIHVLNLDADVGPWLQVLKLKGIVDIAAREANMSSLTGGQLELMNLAGPRSGLDMMDPLGASMPTANFFEQGGYYRNTIVRERTGAELLKALDERMDVNIRKSGAIEFAAVFDEVMAASAARPRAAARAEGSAETGEARVFEQGR